MIAVSTYSGECDGLGVAAEMAGIEVVAYCEIDLKRRAKLAEKHPGKPIFTSDEELTADALHAHGIYPDLLFGGPPCQPFSCAGSQRGTADPRHRWPEMLRCIRECRPRWVVVENVGNFVNLALDLVWSDLEAEGYEVWPIVLPALAVGAPHCRKRCFVVAYRDCTGLQGWGRAILQECAGEQPAGEGGACSVADAIRERELQPEGHFGECRGWSVNGGSVAYTKGEGLQIARYESGINTATGENGVKFSRRRPAQPGLGRDSYGISERLHEIMTGVSAELDEQMPRWPAWRGQEQYEWEPPRTVTGMKDRKRRIESLGLAVVPWQAYPIFALIKAMNDMLDG